MRAQPCHLGDEQVRHVLVDGLLVRPDLVHRSDEPAFGTAREPRNDRVVPVLASAAASTLAGAPADRHLIQRVGRHGRTVGMCWHDLLRSEEDECAQREPAEASGEARMRSEGGFRQTARAQQHHVTPNRHRGVTRYDAAYLNNHKYDASGLAGYFNRHSSTGAHIPRSTMSLG